MALLEWWSYILRGGLVSLSFCSVTSAGATVLAIGSIPGSGQIWLDDVSCAGTETRLINCPSSDVGIHNCAHFEDVGISCQPGKVEQSLQGGFREVHGTVAN